MRATKCHELTDTTNFTQEMYWEGKTQEREKQQQTGQNKGFTYGSLPGEHGFPEWPTYRGGIMWPDPWGKLRDWWDFFFLIGQNLVTLLSLG